MTETADMASTTGAADAVRTANAANTVSAAFLEALDRSEQRESPFRHWLLDEVLPPALYREVAALPFAPPSMDHASGTREANNSARVFFSPEVQAAHSACAAVTEGLGAPATIAGIERICGRPLSGSHLRIEYTMDREGFWLEPHTDIKVKLFTMLIYLAPAEGGEHLGTDIYDGEETWVGSAPFAGNAGMIFLPADDTWHGFRPKPIDGVRRSLIVNFVTDEWRAREELSGLTATG